MANGARGKNSGQQTNIGLVVLLIIIIIASGIFTYIRLTKKKTYTPPPQVQRRPEPPRESPSGEEQAQKESKIQKKSISITKPSLSNYRTNLSSYVEEYLKRYEDAAKQGNWQELAKWAYKKGLFVECYQNSLTAGTKPSRNLFHKDSILIFQLQGKDKGYYALSQNEFERTVAIKSNIAVKDIEKLKEELNNKEFSKDITSQTYLANLIIQVDTPRGRKLYNEFIKQPGFYNILVRELERTFLSHCEDEIWKARWYDCGPMNLWLITQLTRFDASKIVPAVRVSSPRTAKSSKRFGRAPNYMGPQGEFGPTEPNMPPADLILQPADRRGALRIQLTQTEQNIYAHKMLLIKLLARRGGIVSSYLIGKIIEENSSLFDKAIKAGVFESDVLARFTGIYADMLIQPFAKIIQANLSSQAEWESPALILAMLNNSQANHLILKTAGEKGFILTRPIIERMILSADDYVAKNIAPFIENELAEDFDLEKIFLAWINKKESQESQSGGLFQRFFRRPLTPPQKQEMNVNQNIPPSAGMELYPKGPADRTPSPYIYEPRADTRTKSREKTPSRGWPKQYSISRIFKSENITLLLKEIGRIKGKDTEQSMNLDNNYTRESRGLVNVNMAKKSAVRCLISIEDFKNAKYYRELIDDPVAGGFARLGLCVINDTDSCQQLLKHFWKHPLEIDMPIKSTQEIESQKHGIPQFVKVFPGKVSVPLDENGLACCGISAREALIYFNYKEAGEAFISTLGEFITRKERFDQPELVVSAICQIIDAVGRWQPSDSIRTLADLVASANDFGLRKSISGMALSTYVRTKAIEVLGRIGDKEAINIILQLARYERNDVHLALAAKIALAKRGVSEAVDIFISALSAEYKTPYSQRNISDVLRTLGTRFQSEKDIALMGLSNTKLTTQQIEKVFQIINELGEAKEQKKQDFEMQEKIILSLAKNGQDQIISALAKLFESKEKIYYWNNLDGERLNDAFCNILDAIRERRQATSPDIVIKLIKTILAIREQNILQRINLTDWRPQDYIATLSSRSRYPSKMPSQYSPMLGNIQDIPPEFLNQIQAQDINLPIEDIQKLKANLLFQIPITFNLLSERIKSGPEQTRNIDDLAIEVATKLEGNKERNLKELGTLLYYRYICLYKAMQLSASEENVNDLVNAMTFWPTTVREQALVFLGLEKLAQIANPKLIRHIGAAYLQSSAKELKDKLIDTALFIAVDLFKKQIQNKTQLLNSEKFARENTSPWQEAIDSKDYNPDTDELLIILLAIHSRTPECIDKINSIIANQYKDGNPIDETAVIAMLGIIDRLGIPGTDNLLNLYYNILTLIEKPEMERLPQQSDSIGSLRSGGRSRIRRAPSRQTTKTYLYPTASNIIIDSVGKLKGIDTIKALKKIATLRPDLMGSIAFEIYKTDPEIGERYVRQAISATKKDEAIAAQLGPLINYLIINPTEQSEDIIIAAATKGSSQLAQKTISALAAAYTQDKSAQGLDVPDILATILKKMSTSTVINEDTSIILKQIIELARNINTPELNDLADKLEKRIERRQRSLRRR